MRPEAAIESHPVRGAWIEIILDIAQMKKSVCRTPSGVRGLKFIPGVNTHEHLASHPVRGAWIEMAIADNNARQGDVAPRQGCVD